MAAQGFVMDAFAKDHLKAWFDAGHAPYDWDEQVLFRFQVWVTDNADDIYDDSSWPTLARQFENEQVRR